MEAIVMWINANWFWLGPVILAGAVVAFVVSVVDLFSSEVKNDHV